MIFLRLFWEFFKTGLFSVGGGLATLPFLYDMSSSTGWFTTQQLADMIAVSESTPGPIGVNMATYVGFTTGGIPGAIAATLGLVTPEIIVILIIAGVLDKFRSSRYVDAAFYGLRPCSVGLIAAAGVLVARVALFTDSGLHIKAAVMALVLLVLTRWVPKVKNFHPIVFIALSAVAGIIIGF